MENYHSKYFKLAFINTAGVLNPVSNTKIISNITNNLLLPNFLKLLIAPGLTFYGVDLEK